MTSPTDRIAAVLREHGRFGYRNCRCRQAVDGEDGHLAHVAERITAELQPEQNRQLAEAWQAGYNEAKRR